jgi:hypothetical protein
VGSGSRWRLCRHPGHEEYQGNTLSLAPPIGHTHDTSQYVEENAGAAALELTSEEVAAITKIAEEAEIPGERYGPSSLAKILVSSPALCI